ncbi:MAG TPA: nucleotidyltransferase domain-containing protein [Candidatus Aquilonibacter sp.]
MERTLRLGERIRARAPQGWDDRGATRGGRGSDRNAIRKLESGASAEPRFTTRVRIAEALELSSDELAGRIAAIRAIRDLLDHEGVEHLDVFGSVARGDATAESDVDVIVTPRQDAGFSLFNLSAAGNYLEDALARKVDILRAIPLRNRSASRM